MALPSIQDIGSTIGGDAVSLLKDIPGIGPGIANITGGLPTNALPQTSYDFTQRTFPLDLGTPGSYNGHYIVININVQNRTQFQNVTNQAAGRTFPLETLLPGVVSKADQLRYTLDNNFFLNNGQSAGSSSSVLSTRPRYTTRIAESIALYMPNSELTFSDFHDYENVSLTGFASAAVSGIGGVITRLATDIGGSTLGNIVGGVNNIVGAAGNIVGSTAQIIGTPINPKIEVLYANTMQRQFDFDFLFAPTNYQESVVLQQIIKTLRFHAAPEIQTGAAESFFFIPPSEFDISFYYRGQENLAIPKVNTCVLYQIDTSYSPTGVYSTFSNGYPVQVRMMLHFREVEIPSKLRILQGF